MKKMQVTADNFGTIREALKAGETALSINEKITLSGCVLNTEHLSENGKKVRTPFYYIDAHGKRYTSFQLKEKLGIEADTKSSRKETTFASIWVQLQGLAKTAAIEEIKEAAKWLTTLAKEKEKEAKEAKEAKIKELEALLKELKGE